jgi:uncharacterized membrane protein YgcG
MKVISLTSLEGVEAARVWTSNEEAFTSELRLLARIMRSWPGGVSIMAASANLDDWLLQENLQRRLTLRGRAVKIEAEKEAAAARKAAAAADDVPVGAEVSSSAPTTGDAAPKTADSVIEKELAAERKRNEQLQKKLDAAKSSGAKASAPGRGGGNARGGGNSRGGNGRGGNSNAGGRGKGKGKGTPTVAPLKDDGFQVVDNKSKNKRKNKKK